MDRAVFVPARGGSKRLKNKNIYLLNGKPLISYVISTLRRSVFGNSVYVVSDSDDIKDVAWGCRARVISQDPNTATDNFNLDIVYKNAAEKVGAKYSYLVQCTVPLLRVDTVNSFVKGFEQSGCKSGLSVCKFDKFWWANGSAKNYDPCNRPLKHTFSGHDYFETGAIYGILTGELVAGSCRLIDKAYMLETSLAEAIDIDTIDDLKLTEIILRGGYEL